MARFLKSFMKAKGTAPGSMVFIGGQKMEDPRIRLISYNNEKLIEKEFKNIDDAFDQIDPNMINWINIDGLHDVSLIEKIGEKLNISSLALDNIVNTGQRAKLVEDKDSFILLT